MKIYPDAAEDGHPDEIHDIVSLVDTLRDLYPPLDPAGDSEGGLVPSSAPGVPTVQVAPGVLTAPPSPAIDVNLLTEEVRRSSAC